MTSFTKTDLGGGVYLYTSAATALSSQDATVTLDLASERANKPVDSNTFYEVGVSLTDGTDEVVPNTGTVALTAVHRNMPGVFRTPPLASALNFAVEVTDQRFAGYWDQIKVVCTDVDDAASDATHVVVRVVTRPLPEVGTNNTDMASLLFGASVDRTMRRLTLAGGLTLPGQYGVAADVTVDADDVVITASGTAAERDVNLPAAASSTGRVLAIANVGDGSNAVIIDPNASETIDGSATLSLAAANDCAVIVCNGTGWVTLARYVAAEVAAEA